MNPLPLFLITVALINPTHASSSDQEPKGLSAKKLPAPTESSQSDSLVTSFPTASSSSSSSSSSSGSSSTSQYDGYVSITGGPLNEPGRSSRFSYVLFDGWLVREAIEEGLAIDRREPRESLRKKAMPAPRPEFFVADIRVSIGWTKGLGVEKSWNSLLKLGLGTLTLEQLQGLEEAFAMDPIKYKSHAQAVSKALQEKERE